MIAIIAHETSRTVSHYVTVLQAMEALFVARNGNPGGQTVMAILGYVT